MRKSKRQWYNPVCVTAVFAAGLFIGRVVSEFSNGLLQDVIFIGTAVFTFHISNLITDVLKNKSND